MLPPPQLLLLLKKILLYFKRRIYTTFFDLHSFSSLLFKLLLSFLKTKYQQIMDDIRKVIKKNSPPAVVLQTLRTALTMPPSAARNIVKDLTRPLNDQKRFIKKFDNEYWKGALIMSEMIRCDDDIAIKRLQKADLVIFEIHGMLFSSLKPKKTRRRG